MSPLTRPFQALTVFSKFPIAFVNFFEGSYVKSTEIPWYYASKWLLLTLPEFVLVGLFAGIIFVVRHISTPPQKRRLQIGLLIFSTLFPLLYVALTGAALYDAMRHVLFTMPPLIITSALGVGLLWQSSSRNTRYALGGLTGILMVWTCFQMIGLHPNQYVYFNRLLAGGLSKASARYDTDYLDNSYKLGVRWVEKNLSSAQPIRLASGTSTTPYLLEPGRFVDEENPFNADIYLVSRHLNQHQALPGEVLRRIVADGVPLLYIIRPDAAFDDDPLFTHLSNPYNGLISGDLYERANRPEQALAAYQTVLKHDPKLAVAHAAIGRILALQGHTQDAIKAYQMAIFHKATDATIFTSMGDCYVQAGDHPAAIEAYQKALQVRPYYLKALRTLARSYSATSQHGLAIETARKTLFIDPTFVSDPSCSAACASMPDAWIKPTVISCT
jgi:tetratricopeptide (TPR) repeat protein